MGTKHNANRGPWCKVCGAEMNRTNHRFEVSLGSQVVMVTTFSGKPNWDPICGESCLHKELSTWAQIAYAKEKDDGSNQGNQVPMPQTRRVFYSTSPE